MILLILQKTKTTIKWLKIKSYDLHWFNLDITKIVFYLTLILLRCIQNSKAIWLKCNRQLLIYDNLQQFQSNHISIYI